MAQTLRERFEAKYTRGRPDECWLWAGSSTKAGYGQIDVNGIRRYAHRVAMELVHVSLSDGVCVCHRCDVTLCVNPSHLFLGTHADNMADASAKGRMNLGERNGQAKLTRAQVDQIRARVSNDGVTQRQLAREYGVSEMTISWIVRGHHWAKI